MQANKVHQERLHNCFIMHEIRRKLIAYLNVIFEHFEVYAATIAAAATSGLAGSAPFLLELFHLQLFQTNEKNQKDWVANKMHEALVKKGRTQRIATFI